MGYTESGQSRANQGIPRFACNPDLNHARAGVIVTKNLRHFPAAVLAPYDLQAQHPDDFVAHLLDLDAVAA